MCADRVRQYKEIVGLLDIHKPLARKNIPISDVGSLTVWKCRDFPNIRVPELDFDEKHTCTFTEEIGEYLKVPSF